MLTDSSLISPAPDVASSLTAFWQGRPVSNVRLVEISVNNTGHEAIRPDDFATDLNLVIADGDGEFLEAHSISADPSILSPDIQVTTNRVSIKPILLNSGDGFTLRVVTTSPAPLAITAQARIANVHDVSIEDARKLDADGQPLNHNTSSNWDILAIVSFAIIVILLAVLIIPSFVNGQDDWSFRGVNVGFLAWPPFLSLGLSSYWLTLAARGIHFEQQGEALCLLLGAISAVALILLTARRNRVIGPIGSTPSKRETVSDQSSQSPEGSR